MQHWPLDPAAGTDAGLLGVVASVGEATFAQRALGALQAVGVGAGSWSVYRVWPDRSPQLHLAAAAGVPDTTAECFATYADGLYRAERSFDAVAPGTRALLRMRADEVPNRAHRDAIYRRHRIAERLSIAERAADGSVFAVNLYRHQAQGTFDAAGLATVSRQAALLLALVQRHVALRRDAAPPAAVRDRLVQRCPALTARELDVCERLLRGWSHDGIAADLGLTVATVKTYRARAFARLGLHFRSELFAAFGPPQ